MSQIVLDLGDVQLTCETAGESDGPLALLLHGFPDTNYTFRFLMPYLAGLGYRVVAPAMRGYAPSSLSVSGNYQVAALAHDAIALHEALGGTNDAVLIGHDWGAAATYPALAAEPSRWRKAVAMAVPPLAVFGQAFMNYDQLRKSWYMFFFQSPLADTVVGLNDLDFIDRLWNDWSPGFERDADVARVRAALTQPEHLAAAIGYYRAMFTPGVTDAALQYVQDAMFTTPECPVIYLHGENDGCVGLEAVTDTLQYLPAGSEFEVVENAGHFLHVEQPDRVHHLIGEFLGR